MSSKQLKIGALLSYGVIIFNIIAGLLYTPWMIKVIGKNDFGLYILSTTFIAYFVVDYGIWQAINKLISQYRAENNIEQIKKTIGVASKIYLGLDIIVIVILIVIYLLLDNIFINLSPSDLIKFKTVFLISSIINIVNFPFGFVKGVMIAYEYLIENRLIEFISKIFQIFTIIIVLILGGGLYWLVLIYGIVPLIKNIISVFILYKKGVRMIFDCWDKVIVKSVLGVSTWLLFYVIAELFINNFSPTIISIKNTLEQVAVFGIGMTIYGYTFNISNSISGLFLPKVSKLLYNGNIKEIENFAIKIGRIQLFISAYIIFGIIISGSRFIFAWMGTDFNNSYYVAVLLSIPGLIIYTQQIEQSFLFAYNKIMYRTIFMSITALSSVFLSLLLAPKYGAIGVAFSISFSTLIFMALGMSIVYRLVLKLNMKRTYLMIFKFISVFIILTFLIENFIKYVYLPFFKILNKWGDFIIIGIIYSLLFFLASYFILMNKYEKNLIKNLLYKIYK